MAFDRTSDPGGIKKESTDLQRDMAAKGGPTTDLGNPANRQVSSPVSEDIQTQAAAKSTDKKREEVKGEGDLNEPTEESQEKSRSGNNVSGSNH